MIEERRGGLQPVFMPLLSFIRIRFLDEFFLDLSLIMELVALWRLVSEGKVVKIFIFSFLLFLKQR